MLVHLVGRHDTAAIGAAGHGRHAGKLLGLVNPNDVDGVHRCRLLVEQPGLPHDLLVELTNPGIFTNHAMHFVQVIQVKVLNSRCIPGGAHAHTGSLGGNGCQIRLGHALNAVISQVRGKHMVDGGFHHQVVNTTRIHRVVNGIDFIVLAVLKEQRQHQRIPEVFLVGLVVPNAQGIDDILARKIVLVRNAAVVQLVHKRGTAGKMAHHHPDKAARTAHRLIDGLLLVRPTRRNHVAVAASIELIAQGIRQAIAHRNIVAAKQMTTGKLLVFRLVRQGKRLLQLHILNTRSDHLLNTLGTLGDLFGSRLHTCARNLARCRV